VAKEPWLAVVVVVVGSVEEGWGIDVEYDKP
jgi:hypothetical protein